MQDPALKQIQALPGRPQLQVLAARLLDWLSADLNGGEAFTESRARALLVGANLLDEPTRTSFNQLVESEPYARLALYDLLKESGLAANDEVNGLAVAASQSAAERPAAVSWLALAVAGFAWRADFRLDQLDPASQPDPYSPAGQVIKRAGSFIRQQVQRSATERDKGSRKLAYQPTAGVTPDLNALQPREQVAPLPPYYRTPVPVRYPEYTSKVTVDPGEVEQPPSGPERAAPLSIDHSEVAPPPTAAPPPPPPASSTPARQPAIRIDASEVEPPQTPAVIPPPRPAPAGWSAPAPSVSANTAAITGKTHRSKGVTKTTKLRVVVQESPDGAGLYGLQVKVTSQAERRFVAGTTNRDGQFLCELPVKVDAGLTYDVDVTWPRDYGGEIERKSITLNADRTLFVLPFYRTLKA